MSNTTPWSNLAALLVPSPDPHHFSNHSKNRTGRRVPAAYPSSATAPSSAAASFVSTLSFLPGSMSRGSTSTERGFPRSLGSRAKLRKPPPPLPHASPPPKLHPLSFSPEPSSIDLTFSAAPHRPAIAGSSRIPGGLDTPPHLHSASDAATNAIDHRNHELRYDGTHHRPRRDVMDQDHLDHVQQRPPLPSGSGNGNGSTKQIHIAVSHPPPGGSSYPQLNSKFHSPSVPSTSQPQPQPYDLGSSPSPSPRQLFSPSSSTPSDSDLLYPPPPLAFDSIPLPSPSSASASTGSSTVRADDSTAASLKSTQSISSFAPSGSGTGSGVLQNNSHSQQQQQRKLTKKKPPSMVIEAEREPQSSQEAEHSMGSGLSTSPLPPPPFLAASASASVPMPPPGPGHEHPDPVQDQHAPYDPLPHAGAEGAPASLPNATPTPLSPVVENPPPVRVPVDVSAESEPSSSIPVPVPSASNLIPVPQSPPALHRGPSSFDYHSQSQDHSHSHDSDDESSAYHGRLEVQSDIGHGGGRSGVCAGAGVGSVGVGNPRRFVVQRGRADPGLRHSGYGGVLSAHGHGSVPVERQVKAAAGTPPLPTPMGTAAKPSTSRRPSLLRHFSLRSKASPSTVPFSNVGTSSAPATSASTSTSRRKRPAPKIPPGPYPPSSWADVASPLPSSVGSSNGGHGSLTSSSGHTSGAGGYMSAGYTTGGGGYTTDVTSGVPESPGDKSGSKSDFASAFRRWRKWRRKSSGGGKTVIASGGGGLAGAYASRASLGAGFGSGVGVDAGTGMEGLPMPSRPHLGTRSVSSLPTKMPGQPTQMEPSTNEPTTLPEPPQPHPLQKPDIAAASVSAPNSPRQSREVPRPTSYKRHGHKKSTSWSDAAFTLLRGSAPAATTSGTADAPANVNSPEVVRQVPQTSPSAPPVPFSAPAPAPPTSRSASASRTSLGGGVGVVNGRRVLKKERERGASVSLDKERDDGQGTQGRSSGSTSRKGKAKAKFMLGNESDVDLPGPPVSASGSHPPPTSMPAPSTTGPSASTTSLASSSHSRPPLVRRDALINQEAPTGRRRWTLANAMTDERISDAGLVRELERMREVAEWARKRERGRRERGSAAGSRVDLGSDSGHGHGSSAGHGDVEINVDTLLEGDEWDGWDEWDVGREILEGRDVLEMERQKEREKERELERSRSMLDGDMMTESPKAVETGDPMQQQQRTAPPPPIRSATLPISPSAPASSSSSWLKAQRALLTCRELILTERHYHSLLSALVTQGTTATPPPALMKHYAAELVRASEGVLRGMEKEPSARGVARAFLDREEEVEGAYVRWCGVVGGWFVENAGGGVDGGEEGEGGEEATSPLKRTVSTWRKSMPSIPSLGMRERVADKDDEDPNPNPKPVPVKKPAVRELAILPTQRVMRYVLLYRDLLAHTPLTSPSRPLVEQAVEVACRIADKCDRAQGNAAFIVSSTGPGPAPMGSRSNSRKAVRRPSSPKSREVPSLPAVVGANATTTASTSSSSSGCTSSTTTASASTAATSVSPSPSSPLPPASPTTSSNHGHGQLSASNSRSSKRRSTPSPGVSRRSSTTAASLMALGWGGRSRGSSASTSAQAQVPSVPAMGAAVVEAENVK